MNDCIHLRDEVCTNVDCEMVADFPSVVYCQECEHYAAPCGVTILRILFQEYVEANFANLRASHINNDGVLCYSESKYEMAKRAKEAFEDAYIKYCKVEKNEEDKVCED